MSMKTGSVLATHFALELEGIINTKFRRCEGLESETYAYEVEEGGFGIHRFLGRTRFPNLVLEKGITSDDELYQWYYDTLFSEKPVERRSGSVILMHQDGHEVKRWNFHRALPCRWIGPTLDFQASGIAIKRFEMAYEELWLDSSSQNSVSDDVKNAIIDRLYQEYRRGEYDCDIWARDVLDAAGVSNNPIMNPEGRAVDAHYDNMTGGNSSPAEGVNVHIKNGHMSLIIKEGDTYTVAHQGRNSTEIVTSDTGVTTNQYSATYTYTSQQSFENSFWGDGTYYPVQ